MSASGEDLGKYMMAVASELWGDPRKGGTNSEQRFGEGRTVNPTKGTWFDHSADEGGGVIALIERETGRKGKEAVDWLRGHGFHVEDNRPPQALSNRDAKPAGRKKEHPADGAKKELVKSWDYTDENGAVLYQTLRYQFKKPDGTWRLGEDGKPEKTYMQRRKAQDGEDSRDGWVYSLKGARMVPYRLPDLLEALSGGYRVFLVEGEKTADALNDLGVPATCNPMGAKKWWDDLTPHFDGADLVILPDNDDPGREHAALVASKLKGTAEKIGVLELPDLKPKGDAFDWIEAGGTIEQLYELAAAAKPPALPEFKSSFGAVWFHEVGKHKPQRDWLVKNLILANSFGIIYGPPGCGKSFLTSDMMLSCAASALPGRNRPDWFGYRGRPFGVIYVVAEGREDFEIRLHAWRAEHGIEDDQIIPFVFLPTAIDMRSSDADTKRLAEEIAGISAVMEERCGVRAEVVVIDTVARALAGGNENASEVMGAFVINCGKLQEMTKVACIGVHHGGKEAGRGPRGHEALHGAADFEIEVSGATPDTPNLWSVRKLKAGPGGATHRFRLRQKTLGEDVDGDPITSCVVVSQQATEEAAGEEKPKGWKVNDTEREFLTVLADMIEKRGVMPPSDVLVPPKVALIVASEDVRTAYKEKFSGTETGTDEQIEARLRQRWSRATKSLLKFGIIGSKKPWLWFTGKQVRNFRIRGINEIENSYVEPPPAEADDLPPEDDVLDLLQS
ncbi:AAA family ATPase [Pararhizobium haloflavum]|uniref:AAA family ATPase n=1 Tax=Pararhizobium haloflavum TaxID=2037914 RepID=UPI000C19A4EE|nr:AAA family ATPase [Pararhizobium haloflavum]